MKIALIAAAAAAPLFAGAAIAGPYVNIESNSGFGGSDYDSTLLETHIGYESELGESASWYIQGGPAMSFVDGEDDNTTELSGKVGVGFGLTENLSAYGEVAVITTEEIDFDEDLNANVKLGVKYNF